MAGKGSECGRNFEELAYPISRCASIFLPLSTFKFSEAKGSKFIQNSVLIVKIQIKSEK